MYNCVKFIHNYSKHVTHSKTLPFLEQVALKLKQNIKLQKLSFYRFRLLVFHIFANYILFAVVLQAKISILTLTMLKILSYTMMSRGCQTKHNLFQLDVEFNGKKLKQPKCPLMIELWLKTLPFLEQEALKLNKNVELEKLSFYRFILLVFHIFVDTILCSPQFYMQKSQF